MCISYPGRVLAIDGTNAVVETDGRTRRASTVLVPDASAGDWVMVGAGSILRRLDDLEAASLIRLLDAAQRDTASQLIPQGGRP